MKFMFWMVGFVCMSLLLVFGFVAMHEFGHQQISLYHGCVRPDMNVSLLGGTFECLEYRERSDTERLQEAKMQSLQEIIGYNILILITAYLMISTFNKNTIE